MIVLALLLGCRPPEDPEPPEDAACPDAPSADAAAEGTAMPTVVRVRWTTPTPTRGRVVYDNGDGRERATAWEDTPRTDHEALLVGLLPEADVGWRVETEGEEDPACAGAGTATTGALPAGLPDLEASDLDPDRSSGSLTVVPVFTEEMNWVVVIDEEGRYVWADAPVPGGGLANTIFRAALTRDGTAIAWNLQAATVDLPGTLGRTALDGTRLEPVEVAGSHTDFVELDGGRWATLGWEIRTFDGRKMLGDTVLVVEADGRVRELWNTFDHFTPDLTREWQKGFYQGDPDVEDWTHANGIAWDEASGDFLVTATFDEGVFRIDGETGAQEWVLSDREGDWTTNPEAGLTLELPHSVQDLGDDRLLVFNRGDPQDPTSCSEALEVHLDPGAGTAARGWSWSTEDCLFVAFLGQARRLEGGNTAIDWCSSGRIDEVAPEGDLVARFELSAGAAFGYSDHVALP